MRRLIIGCVFVAMGATGVWAQTAPGTPAETPPAATAPSAPATAVPTTPAPPAAASPTGPAMTRPAAKKPMVKLPMATKPIARRAVARKPAAKTLMAKHALTRKPMVLKLKPMMKRHEMTMRRRPPMHPGHAARRAAVSKSMMRKSAIQHRTKPMPRHAAAHPKTMHKAK